MLRKDWKYIVYLSAAFVFYMALKLLSPRDLDWTITFHHKDKNPFGAYALDQLIGSIISKNSIQQSNYTLYELYDTLQKPTNFLSLSSSFSPGKEDCDALLKNIEKGGTAFIAAQYFRGRFADTLSLNTSDYFFDGDFTAVFNRNDSTGIHFKNPGLHQQQIYLFPRKNIHNYFDEVDTTRTQIVATNDLDLPVLIKISWGKGFLYLSSTPLTFTNAYLLYNQNAEFASLALSHLPDRTTYWTEFYHLGRLEARTPLRFILTNEPLSWAYYIAILSILLFMIFEARRRQRVIPIIKPLANTSVEFVQTIGNLYYQSADHKNIAEKRIAFLLEQLRSKYGINAHQVNEQTLLTIAKRTGHAEEKVRELFKLIGLIQGKNQIAESELKSLNEKLDQFNY
ncbi:MAG: hypothetical protein KF846_08945 [Cyclobacteriaceae bacterium]|nr:hypothetical protein [Cyclobacteriaceae bacterium]